MKLKKHDYILIAICIVAVLITSLILGLNKTETNEEVTYKKNSVKLLDNYSRFFTIESCVYRFISYLQDKDVDSLLKVLDSNYVEENSLNESNVLEFLGQLEGLNTFSVKKVYYNNKDKNVITYYVYGQIVEEVIDTYSYYGTDKYYVVKLDTVNMTFSIKPIEKSLFSEVSNG